VKTAPDQILRPKTPQEAGSLLEKMGEDVGLLWLGARAEAPETWARASMIDISGLGLDYITVADDGVAIGSATPIQKLVEDESLEAAFGGLVNTAARRLAHYGLRNLASIGGAMNSRFGPPELFLALLALGSQAALVGASETTVPLAEMWSGEEIHGLLKEIRLPRTPAGDKGWGLEWLARSPMDQALAAACAVVEVKGGKIHSPRLAVASLGWAPSRVDQAETILDNASAAGWTPDDLIQAVQLAISPDPEFRASSEYQRDMMARLAGRAVQAALKKAGT
jgi:CO/xanthine dehydrogenase FAD-binding subunit